MLLANTGEAVMRGCSDLQHISGYDWTADEERLDVLGYVAL